jgi:serine/threonine-protein kinase
VSIERLRASLADRYTIERELGAGGMATVYLAQDLKHDRKVAIKVLKPELAAVLGADRFVVEIKTTAALQHPHILPLFDSGEAIVPPMIDDRSSTIDHRSSSFLFYVMPYIQGETLRAKLDRETQFGIDEAVRIARDVADALDYAHRHGVVHRDIKPENILLHDGRPMVADFGIALALSAAAGGRMTETGMSLGTPHYMSPEQATADKEISGRSDIYSLGSVLYEMLTGNPPHTGSSAQQIIMKIIAENVEPVTKYRKSVPPNVAAAVAKSLEKLPADRFESAKAFADALGNTAFATMHATSLGGGGGRSFKRPFVAMSVVAAVATIGLVAASAGWLRRAPEEPFRRVDLTMGDVTPSPRSDVVISPDGSMLAMVGTVGSERAIYLRDLDGDAEFRKLAGTETGSNAAFSPDGQWIVFRKDGDRSLMKVSVNGGGSVTVLPGGKLDPYFPQWGTADQIFFTTPSASYRVAAGGGEAVELSGIANALSFPLPDGSGFLHGRNGRVQLYDFKAESSVVLIPSGGYPVYLPSGYLLYVASDGGLYAVRFDLAKRRIDGDPVRMLERVGTTILSRGYAVSTSGVLVQHDAPGRSNSGENALVIVDLTTGADTLRLPPARRGAMRFSPNGRVVAMDVLTSDRNGERDIYTLDLVTGTYTQLTFEGDNHYPVWSPDGTQILFNARVAGDPSVQDLFIKPADNSAPARRLTDLHSTQLRATQWLEDGRLLFDVRVPDRGWDIFTMKADSGSVPVPYLQSPVDEQFPQVAPDRTLIAYHGNENGGQQVWLRTFPVPQGKWKVSERGGGNPRWSPDGRYIYFWRGGPPMDSLFRARVDRTPAIVVQAEEFVLAMSADNVGAWNFHPDGKRFIVTVPAVAGASSTGASSDRYLMLQGVFGELRRLTAGKPK